MAVLTGMYTRDVCLKVVVSHPCQFPLYEKEWAPSIYGDVAVFNWTQLLSYLILRIQK